MKWLIGALALFWTAGAARVTHDALLAVGLNDSAATLVALAATGPDAIRDRLNGAATPAAHLLRETGELIHVSDRVNPDTGALGRDGRITQVTWQQATDQATIALDNTRSNFDNLLARLAVVQGAGQ